MYAANIANKTEDDLLAESFNSLVNENRKWIQLATYKIALKFSRWITTKSYDLDDIKQEGLVYAWYCYKKYTEKRKANPAIVPPGKWLYIKVFYGAFYYLSDIYRKSKKITVLPSQMLLNDPDLIENAPVEYDLYDFDHDEKISLLNKKIYELPEKERMFAISYLHNDGQFWGAVRACGLDPNSANNQSHLRSAFEILKVKIELGLDGKDSKKLRGMDFITAMSFAIENSSKSLAYAYCNTKAGRASRYKIFKDFMPTLESVSGYINISNKKLKDITEADCVLLIEKLKMSGYSGFSFSTNIRFLFDRLITMGILDTNPVPFGEQYKKRKLTMIKGGVNTRGKKQDENKFHYNPYKDSNNFKPIAQLLPNGNVVMYHKSIQAAASFLDLKPETIMNLTDSDNRMCRGYFLRSASYEEAIEYWMKNDLIYSEYQYKPDSSKLKAV